MVVLRIRPGQLNHSIRMRFSKQMRKLQQHCLFVWRYVGRRGIHKIQLSKKAAARRDAGQPSCREV